MKENRMSDTFDRNIAGMSFCSCTPLAVRETVKENHSICRVFGNMLNVMTKEVLHFVTSGKQNPWVLKQTVRIGIIRNDILYEDTVCLENVHGE